MTGVPKAVLYYSPVSIWSAVALLTIEEKGYGKDEIDLRIVDITKGENYDPTFLRLNPSATVPTLIVPYENSLTEDVESRYKALTDTKAIVAFLDKSRSALSRTQTTSSAPAPALTPATIAATTTCKVIIDEILHAEIANPNTLRFFNARDDASLRSLSEELLPSLTQRQGTLIEYLSQALSGSLRVSDRVKKLWVEKLDAINLILAVLVDAGKSQAELDETAATKRASFFKSAHQAWETSLVQALTELDKEMVGPFTLGDQFSVADLHLAGWLARVIKLAGGTGGDDGSAVVKKLEAYIGNGYHFPQNFITEQARRENVKVDRQTKLGAFWDAIRERSSWKKIYADGIF